MTWDEIVVSSLTWEQAHVTLEKALRGLPPNPRGASCGIPALHLGARSAHTTDAAGPARLLRQPVVRTAKWPADYWPKTQAPPDEKAWTECLDAIRKDAEALAKFATENAATLTERIPHGTGQTFLRTVLVAVDHNAYHVGQIVSARRLLGSWPPPAA